MIQDILTQITILIAAGIILLNLYRLISRKPDSLNSAACGNCSGCEIKNKINGHHFGDNKRLTGKLQLIKMKEV